MKNHSILLRLSSAIFFFILSSPILLAAEDAAEGDPVWVLSYAAFIFFAAAVVMIGLFFSKRKETSLDIAEQKTATKLRAERAAERRKEKRRERMAAARARR
ncbi:MAG: hypothetical protein ACOX0A_05685 [Thermoguttaceae bacterium]|jgi:energy-converting hydrogenase Eha subunit H